jgi:DNA-binding NtrC family response regulator
MTHITIIDDETQITGMLQKALSKNTAFSVTTFNNPITALEKLPSAKPDVVLLDIMMPQMDGIEVLANIKKISPATKVIMMTAYSTLDKVLNSHKLGAESYILKPFESLSDVAQKITNLMNTP